jgi:hypothetical protein
MEARGFCAHGRVLPAGNYTARLVGLGNASAAPEWNCCACGRSTWWPFVLRTASAEVASAEQAVLADGRADECMGGPSRPPLRTLRVSATTFNRPEVVEVSAWSLRVALEQHPFHDPLKVAVSLHVYDDASTQYGAAALRCWYGPNATIVRNRRDDTHGASSQMVRIYRDFLLSHEDAVVVADSDLLFPPRWVSVLQQVWPCSTGWLSVMTHTQGGTPCGEPLGGNLCAAMPWQFFSGDIVGGVIPLAGNAGSVLGRAEARKALLGACGHQALHHHAPPQNCTDMMDLRLGKALHTAGMRPSMIYPLGLVAHIGTAFGVHGAPGMAKQRAAGGDGPRDPRHPRAQDPRAGGAPRRPSPGSPETSSAQTRLRHQPRAPESQ